MAPYRGGSRLVITLVLERLMDKAAAAFGIEPTEIRRRNLIDKFPHTSATGLVFDDGTYKENMEMAIKAIDLVSYRKRQKHAREHSRYFGIGYATFSERTGYSTPAFAAHVIAST